MMGLTWLTQSPAATFGSAMSSLTGFYGLSEPLSESEGAGSSSMSSPMSASLLSLVVVVVVVGAEVEGHRARQHSVLVVHVCHWEEVPRSWHLTLCVHCPCGGLLGYYSAATNVAPDK